MGNVDFIDFKEEVPSTHFTSGMWHLQAGVEINWAVESFKTEIRNNSLYSLMATKHISHRGDTLNCPTISQTLSAPRDGIITYEAVHHKAQRNNNPAFDTHPDPKFAPEISVDSAKGTSLLRSGELTAENALTPDGFHVEFQANGKRVTHLGFRSVGHVTDYRPGLNKPLRYMTVQLGLEVHEKIYGLGERFGPLVKNGQSVQVYNCDGGTSSDLAYKNVPFYYSSRGYGVFIDTPGRVMLEVQAERTTRVNIVVPSQTLKLHIIYGGSPKEVLAKYCGFTGFPALPPAWSFGLWLSTSFTTQYDIGTVRSFLRGMKERGIPLSVFHFDCFWMKGFQWCDFGFDEECFGTNPAEMIAEIKREFGVKICLWINPYIGQEAAVFDEAVAGGFLLKRRDGSVFQTDAWQAGMGVVDFSNPKACEWYKRHLKRLLSYGVDAFKTDFGERIPSSSDIEYYSHQNPDQMHNYYAYIYNKLVFDTLLEHSGPNTACLFARSATATCQQFPVHWGGDCESTYVAMAESLRGGLSLTLSGFGFWSHDIGGFEGLPDAGVYKRWLAFGLLSSHSRLHGSGSYRVPWEFGPEACAVADKFGKLKLRLMPYLYAAAIEANKRGVSVMRATFVEYPEDPVAYDCDTQYFLGDALLVAPVFGNEDVRYYLPWESVSQTGARIANGANGVNGNSMNAVQTTGVSNVQGQWISLLTEDHRTGGQHWEEKHSFLTLPLLARPNSMFVTGANETSAEYAWDENFTVNVNIDPATFTKPVKVGVPNPQKIGEYSYYVELTAEDSGKFAVRLSAETKAVANAVWSVNLLSGSPTIETGEVLTESAVFSGVLVEPEGAEVVFEV